MRRLELMISSMAVAGLLATASLPAQTATGEGSADPGARARPPGVGSEASYPQDPADSAYREARDQLNRGNYRRAAELFERLRERHPESEYVAQAYYWQAFALYRSGGDSDLYAGLEALEALQERYPDSRETRDAEALTYRISGELARRGDREAAERVAREARELRGAGQAGECPEEQDEIKVAALNALLQMNTEQALPILKRVLERRDACSAEMRRKAVFLVSQHMDDETIDVLLGVVRDDPDAEVRGQAVFWLSQVQSEEALDALEGILMESEDRQLQEKAIFAISQHRSERAGRILRDYAMREGSPADLREKAIFWIGQQRTAANAQFLRDLYGSTNDAELKEKVIFSLAQMGGANSEWLLEIAMDESEPVEVRKKAIFWAGQAGISVAQLGRLYDRMSDPEIKGQLIFALSQRNEKEAVDKMLEIAKTEQDKELRKKAIFWLSQSNDPRVAEFLLEIIER